VKRSALALFIIGLLLEGVAFLSSQAENVPFVLGLLSPRYVAAQTALSTSGSEFIDGR
jgi:hypothetical protein